LCVRFLILLGLRIHGDRMYRLLRIVLGLLACASLLIAQQPQKIKINYAARTGTTWPLYIAKDGVITRSMAWMWIWFLAFIRPAPAVKYVLDHPADEQVGAHMKKFDFRAVLDNSILDRLVKQGFFERLFGSGIKAEEERKAKIAFRYPL